METPALRLSKKSFRHDVRIFKLSKKFKNTCRLNAKGAFRPLHTSPAALSQTSSARFFDSLRSERYRSDLLICCILGFLFFGQTRFRWFFARGSMALNSALIDLEIDAFQIVSADDHSLAAALRNSISSKREPAVTASSTER